MRGSRPLFSPLSAPALYLAIRSALWLLGAMVYSIEMVYLAVTVHLNPFQLVLVGVLGQALALVFEVPTGALADLYSRRWAVIFGVALGGLGCILEGAVPLFAAVVLAVVLRGFGDTVRSGADAAWIADEVGPDRTSEVSALYLRSEQFGLIASLLGVGAAAVLASIRLNLSILVAGALFLVLAALLALVMPEDRYSPTPREKRTTSREVVATMLAGARLIRRSPTLLALLGIAAVLGVYQEGLSRLFQVHILYSFHLPPLPWGLKSVVWFPLIEVGIVITGVLSMEVMKRWLDLELSRVVALVLAGILTLTMGGVLAFATAGIFPLALAGFFAATFVSGPVGPLTQGWTNQHLEPATRATVFSLNSQATALAAIIGGPLLGALATDQSTRAGLIATALTLLPAIPLCLLALQNKRGARVEEESRERSTSGEAAHESMLQ